MPTFRKKTCYLQLQAEHGSIPTEIKFVGNRSTHYGVKTAVQSSLLVILYVISSLKQRNFRFNITLQFHETDFIPLVSFVYGLPWMLETENV
jgi:hypothetical protein